MAYIDKTWCQSLMEFNEFKHWAINNKFKTPYGEIIDFTKCMYSFNRTPEEFGLDSRLNIHDFLLAEMTFNFLATINNTLNKDMELKKDSECDEPETISEIVPHPLKFNVKTQPCVLTNQGIVTEVIKFD